MANKHLSRKSMNIDEHNWYYEDRDGIALIHSRMGSDGNLEPRAEHIKISWRKLRASLGRKDRKL